MRRPFVQFDVVCATAIRDSRFTRRELEFARYPREGDIGAVLEVLTAPEPAYLVECLEPQCPHTAWLEFLYPDELELAASDR